MKPFIKVENLNFKYKNVNNYENDYILKNINLDIKKGEFVAIIGQNGSGKSTLAKHFNGLLIPSSGRVFINNMNTSDKNNKYEIHKAVGFIFQNPDNQIISDIVEEDVAFGPENLGLNFKEIQKRVNESLKMVDMYKYKKSLTNELSGGQKQKIAIAGVLSMNPQCIVFDEATSMLDPVCREDILNLAKKLNTKQKTTIIFITHYMEEALKANRIIVMNNGKIVKDSTPEKIFSDITFLKEHNLVLPQCAELVYTLKNKGYDFEKIPFTTAECIDILDKMIIKELNR